MLDLPEIFNDFTDAKKQGFLTVKKLKEQGKNIVGIFCAYTPKELIMAAGAVSVGLCGTDEEPIPEAEKHLPRNLCPLIKSSYGNAISNRCPYFYFSDLLVGETTCDGKKKMYEYLGEIKPMHVMQLPQSAKGEQSFQLWKSEIIAFKKCLEDKFDVEITDDNLREAIRQRNEERTLIKEFYKLNALCPPAMKGYDMQQVLYGAGFKLDREEHVSSIKALIKQIEDEYANGVRNVSASAPRILITGCPIGGATDKIIKAIEDNGGVVVCMETCGGAKSNDKLVDESMDPIDALARYYLDIPCSVMTPNDDRLLLLSSLIEEYKIDGVVEVILQACHTYNVEGQKIKNHVNNKKNIPYLCLETDYSKTDTGQLATRMGAFLEMIGK